jgi:hypothetical protein
MKLEQKCTIFSSKIVHRTKNTVHDKTQTSLKPTLSFEPFYVVYI